MVAVAGVIILALGIALIKKAPPAHTIVMETAHLPSVVPHEHRLGEAVEDAGHHEYMLSPLFVAPEDMWISKLEFKIYNAPETLVHHASLLNWDERHQTCSSLPFKQLFILAQDTMHHPFMEFPEGSGIFVRKGQHLQLSVMIHNPGPPIGPGGIYNDVYGQLTLTMLAHSPQQPPKEIHPYLLHLDDNPCVIQEQDQSDAYVFSVPARRSAYAFSGSSSPFNPGEYTFQSTSTVVYIGAHLHGWQGGKQLIVEKNGSALLTFDTAHALDDSYRYDTPYYPTSLEMKPGDRLKIRALYANPSPIATRGVMGDLGIYFFEHE